MSGLQATLLAALTLVFLTEAGQTGNLLRVDVDGSKCLCPGSSSRKERAVNTLKDSNITHGNKTDNVKEDSSKDAQEPLWESIDDCPPAKCTDSRKKAPIKGQLSTAEMYGYGTLAVLLISLCSVAGVLLVPLARSNAYKHIVTGFVAFGIGIMVGDTLLHLLPEVLGINTHKPQILWHSLVVMVTVYGLFTFETVMDLVHHRDKVSHRCPRRHSHSHIPFPEDIVFHRESPLKSGPPSPDGTPAANIPPTETHDFRRRGRLTGGLRTLALVIIVGDAVHNLGDGLAVGAALTSGSHSGLTTSLAIFCHELPHEFGDFVLLMSTGLSFRRALLANLASALTAFIGLYIGISLGSSEAVRHWIFAFTAGMFLYIALGDMLPELRNHNKNVGVFLAQNVGMLLGMVIMTLMAAAETGLLS